VLCCQVLEHIPFDTVPKAINELCRVSGRRLVISLPDQSRTVTFDLHVGRRRRFFKRLSIARRNRFEFDGVHHLELGTGNYQCRTVRAWLDQTSCISA
jgi:hypothetical protein